MTNREKIFFLLREGHSTRGKEENKDGDKTASGLKESFLHPFKMNPKKNFILSLLIPF